MTLTYHFNVSPELVVRMEEARYRHISAYGVKGVNSTLDIFFQYVITRYIESDVDFVDDAIIDLYCGDGLPFGDNGSDEEDIDPDTLPDDTDVDIGFGFV